MSPQPTPPPAPGEPAPKPSDGEGGSARDGGSEDSEGEISSDEGEASPPGDGADAAASSADRPAGAQDQEAPPLPDEPVPGGPPLPNEPVPAPVDDGWDCQWDPNSQAWFFHNRFTGVTQWENPRVQNDAAAAAPRGSATDGPRPPAAETPVAGGYNPAIHGDYDPNAWYARGGAEDENAEQLQLGAGGADPYAATASFNRFTGQFQSADMGPDRHTDEAKSRRQMNAFFDVDAAANAHDGRSLKAERSNKKPSKAELKGFKEKRRARKEEKRRAWLRD